MLRYRTGDISAVDARLCSCGRTTARMSRIRGRIDDMLIIRGVNMFPSQIEEQVLAIPALAPNYLIQVRRNGAMDELTVDVESRGAISDDDRSRVVRELSHKIKTFVGVSAQIVIGEPGSMAPSQGKAVRVIDHRRSS